MEAAPVFVASGSTKSQTCAVTAAARIQDAGAVLTPAFASRVALVDIRLSRAGARGDDAFFLELARDGNDLLLGLFDVAQADRTEHLHFFLHEIDGAFGHVAEHTLANHV